MANVQATDALNRFADVILEFDEYLMAKAFIIEQEAADIQRRFMLNNQKTLWQAGWSGATRPPYGF